MEQDPIRLGEVDGGARVPKKLVQRKKRGPAKKHKTKAELERAAATDRMKDLIDGRISIDDLDDEEILRGQLRDVNGNFSGAKPLVVPRMFADALQRRVVDITTNTLRAKYAAVLDRHVDIAINGPAKEAVAAQIHVIERMVGKVPDKMEIKQEVSVFQKAVESGAFLVDYDDGAEDAELEEE